MYFYAIYAKITRFAAKRELPLLGARFPHLLLRGARSKIACFPEISSRNRLQFVGEADDYVVD